MWSPGWGPLEASSKVISKRLKQAYTDRYEVACYSLPDGKLLEGHLKKLLRRRIFSPPEFKMFLLTLREAVEAWQLLIPKSSIILIREIVGASVQDDEMMDSLKTRWPR
jgi:hypothetical protein